MKILPAKTKTNTNVSSLAPAWERVREGGFIISFLVLRICLVFGVWHLEFFDSV